VDQRKMTPIAGGMESGGRLGDVLADRRRVTDVAIALAELVVGQADAS